MLPLLPGLRRPTHPRVDQFQVNLTRATCWRQVRANSWQCLMSTPPPQCSCSTLRCQAPAPHSSCQEEVHRHTRTEEVQEARTVTSRTICHAQTFPAPWLSPAIPFLQPLASTLASRPMASPISAPTLVSRSTASQAR